VSDTQGRWTKEKLERVAHRIRNYGRCCIDCGESLTLAERALGDCYCLCCYPLVERKEEKDNERH
jgi:hypothetical protein